MKSFKQFINERVTVSLSYNPEDMGSYVKDNGKGAIVDIPMRKIISTFEGQDKTNPETASEESKHNVEKLKQAIEKGRRIEPIIVRKYKDGYQVVDGHHRYQAHKDLNKTFISAKIARKNYVTELDKPEDYK